MSCDVESYCFTNVIFSASSACYHIMTLLASHDLATFTLKSFGLQNLKCFLLAGDFIVHNASMTICHSIFSCMIVELRSGPEVI